MFGKQGVNPWVQYGKKAYLVEPEHCRRANPDEEALSRPGVQLDLAGLETAIRQDTFEDLTEQQAAEDEVEQAAGRKAAEKLTMKQRPLLPKRRPLTRAVSPKS